MRATPLRALVDRRFPGCPHAESVDYVAVAARLDLQGAVASSPAAAVRPVPTGRSAAIHMWTVMVWCRQFALLRDARPVVLENTAHGGLFGSSWYGSVDRIPPGWTALELISPRSLESNHAIIVTPLLWRSPWRRQRLRQRGSVALAVTVPAGVAALASANQASRITAVNSARRRGRDPDIEAIKARQSLGCRSPAVSPSSR